MVAFRRLLGYMRLDGSIQMLFTDWEPHTVVDLVPEELGLLEGARGRRPALIYDPAKWPTPPGGWWGP